MIVLLEDVDRVEGLADVVDELTAGYPAATVLTTAVRPTRVVGERLIRLSPLPLPDDDAPPDHPALLLFAARPRPRAARSRTSTTRSSAPTSPASADEAGGLPGSDRR